MAYQHSPEPTIPHERAPPNPGPYKFTSEELRVLRECNRESFYQRCLPIGTILGFSTYYAIQSGYLKPSIRFGAIPKVSAAVIVGYFMGKFSYQKKCAEKLMALPNSEVGEMLRKRRNKTIQEGFEPGFGPAMTLQSFGDMPQTQTYSDLDSFGSTRPQYDGLDDSQRPTIDNNIVFEEEEMPPQQKQSVSYEELRRKNREEYQNKQRGLGRSLSQPTSPPAQSSTDNSPPIHKNKYGDLME